MRNQIRCIDTKASGDCDIETLYDYDAYGNLVDDGVNTYTYDAAMRLVSVTDGVTTTSHTYNGDGDRISQTVDSVTTTYVIDTATPLTMVLSETTALLPDRFTGQVGEGSKLPPVSAGVGFGAGIGAFFS